MNDQSLEYQVSLPVFEGPLDLLLHLVQKRELDITAISLASVADQYLAYLKTMEENDPESIVNFLVIAAKLLVIKSWALLPSSDPSEEEEEMVQDLTAALLEYQLFKKAAEELRAREENDIRVYPRVAKPVTLSQPILEKVPLEELMTALLSCIREEIEEDDDIPLPTRIYTIQEKVDIINRSLASESKVSFITLLSKAASRLEIIVTFLAVLELLKRGQVEVEQDSLFAEIYLLAK